MRKANYKKMDKFVNEMNQSVNIVGDMSIYLFNRFRNFVGYLFVAITTVAISFIVAEFVRGFKFAPINGVDAYYIALFSSLVIGLYIAFYGEEAKIATIKGAIFSSGSNRTWQAGAAGFIILVLIIVNAKGVQKIADFSLRYMDTELKDSVIFKLKEQKMKNHTSLANSAIDFSGQQRIVDNLNATRARYQNARNSASQNKLSTWDWKIRRLDKEISIAQDKLYKQQSQASQSKSRQLSHSDDATEDLIAHYKQESSSNKSIVNNYKDIGLIVAIGGEVIDGFLAFLLFMIVKSNPNVNGTPKVQENTRKMMRLKSYESEIGEKKEQPTLSQNKEKPYQPESNGDLNDKLYNKIKKAAMLIAKERNNYIEVGMNRYLNHPSQRELIKAFGELGVLVTPYQVGDYFTKMQDEIMFVNQKLGFVYTRMVQRKVA